MTADRPGEPDAGPLAVVAGALQTHFGRAPARASVSFVGVEPIEVLRFATGVAGEFTYATVGMSRHPMSGADSMHVDPDAPRAELVLRVRDADDRYPDLWRSLAVLAAAPAVESVVHRAGATVDLGGAMVTRSRCTGVVVGDAVLPPVDVAGWSSPVAFLGVTPATADELAWARVHGSAALHERWRERATDLRDPGRASVPLD